MSDRKEYIEELWSSLLPVTDGSRQQNRIHKAVDIIEKTAEVLRSPLISSEDKGNAVGYALAVFQLLAADLLDWLPKFVTGADIKENADGLQARFEAMRAFFYADHCIQPQFRSHLKTVIVALPQSCFEQMRSGLEALNFGEALPIFEPSFSYRQGDTWSWDQARMTAIEHVLFLCGQDVPKGKARTRVAQAIGCVSAETLKSWEERDLKAQFPSLRFSLAKIAGELTAREQSDPVNWLEDSRVNAHTISAMRSLKGQLANFGRAYAETHGDRHRSLP